MAQNSRQTEILELVREKGFVSVTQLSEHFQVTTQTIRRDIKLLSDEGLLRRHHGGVTQPSSVENISYDSRKELYREEKERIAEMVAEQIPDAVSLFINIGTTTEAVAQALVGHRGLRVITNNLNVANILVQHPECDLIIAGGQIRPQDGGIVGKVTTDFIEHYKVDVCVMGTSSIDEDGSLLDYDNREVLVSKAMMQNARRTFLVADHSKFTRAAMMRVGHIRDVDAFFTDRPVESRLVSLMQSCGVSVHVARPKEPPIQLIHDAGFDTK